jgi:hypothetical protein
MTRYGNSIQTTTEVFEGEAGKSAYFTWIQGKTPSTLFPYADETIFCNQRLARLDGYPRTNTVDLMNCLVDVDFTPQNTGSPLLLHVVLPMDCIPDRIREPFTHLKGATVWVHGTQIVATFPCHERIRTRFWIRPLRGDESIKHFRVESLFDEAKELSPKLKLELNFGILKLTFG